MLTAPSLQPFTSAMQTSQFDVELNHRTLEVLCLRYQLTRNLLSEILLLATDQQKFYQIIMMIQFVKRGIGRGYGIREPA